MRFSNLAACWKVRVKAAAARQQGRARDGSGLVSATARAIADNSVLSSNPKLGFKKRPLPGRDALSALLVSPANLESHICTAQKALQEASVHAELEYLLWLRTENSIK